MHWYLYCARSDGRFWLIVIRYGMFISLRVRFLVVLICFVTCRMGGPVGYGQCPVGLNIQYQICLTPNSEEVRRFQNLTDFSLIDFGDGAVCAARAIRALSATQSNSARLLAESAVQWFGGQKSNIIRASEYGAIDLIRTSAQGGWDASALVRFATGSDSFDVCQTLDLLDAMRKLSEDGIMIFSAYFGFVRLC